MQLFRSYKCSGYITVYLGLIILVLSGFAFGIISMARQNIYRKLAYDKTSTAAESMLSDYCIPLEKYGIYGIDGGYETGKLSLNVLENNLKDNVAANDLIFGERSGAPQLQKIEVTSAEMLITNEFDELKNDIKNYVKYHLSVDMAKDYLSDLSGIDAAMEEKDVFAEELSTAKEEPDENESEPDRDDSVNASEKDPREEVNRIMKMGILAIVLPRGFQISEKEMGENCCINSPEGWDMAAVTNFKSKESVNNMLSDVKGILSDGADSILIDEYILAIFGNALKNTEDTQLKYEAEYILCGKDKDKDNLKKTAKKIIGFRTIMNISHILSDSVKRGEARAMAVSLTVLFPYLEELTYYLIISAWAYSEAVIDARLLYSGRKVPLFKTGSQWITDLSNIGASVLQGESSNNYGKDGLSYEDYLRIMLLSIPEKSKLSRIAGIIEADIKKKEGYEEFCIGNCVKGFTCSGIYEMPGIDSYKVVYRTHY